MLIVYLFHLIMLIKFNFNIVRSSSPPSVYILCLCLWSLWEVKPDIDLHPAANISGEEKDMLRCAFKRDPKNDERWESGSLETVRHLLVSPISTSSLKIERRGSCRSECKIHRLWSILVLEGLCWQQSLRSGDLGFHAVVASDKKGDRCQRWTSNSGWRYLNFNNRLLRV